LTQHDFLVRIALALQHCSIPGMLVGSYASSLHGMPRTTVDIDMVIDPTPSQIDELLRLLPETEYYVSREAALEALEHRSQFNVIEIEGAWKLDLIIAGRRAFDRSQLSRRSPQAYGDVLIDVASAEDTIVAKLEWSKMGGSERQLEEVAGIIRLRGNELDTRYIERWVGALELEPQWERARTLAGAQ
jgi:hypothetical protein